MWVIAADGEGRPGQLIALADVEPDPGPAWSPDGERIAFVRVAHTVMVASADGSAARPVHVQADGVGSLWWSPDGTCVAVAAGSVSEAAGRVSDRRLGVGPGHHGVGDDAGAVVVVERSALRVRRPPDDHRPDRELAGRRARDQLVHVNREIPELEEGSPELGWVVAAGVAPPEHSGAIFDATSGRHIGSTADPDVEPWASMPDLAP